MEYKEFIDKWLTKNSNENKIEFINDTIKLCRTTIDKKILSLIESGDLEIGKQT